jgi:hypothetical protein
LALLLPQLAGWPSDLVSIATFVLAEHASVADYPSSSSSVTILPKPSFSFEAQSMERLRSNNDHDDDACGIHALHFRCDASAAVMGN